MITIGPTVIVTEFSGRQALAGNLRLYEVSIQKWCSINVLCCVTAPSRGVGAVSQ
jgi:hypothetical protein